MKLAVYDLDGSLVDSTHRYRAVNGKIDLDYWIANEHKAYNDTLTPLYNNYIKDCTDKNTIVVIATARVINAIDSFFIYDYLQGYDYIISRKGRNDKRRGGAMKIEGLKPIIESYNFTSGIFYEDNLEYINAVCNEYPIIEPFFCISNQGH